MYIASQVSTCDLQIAEKVIRVQTLAELFCCSCYLHVSSMIGRVEYGLAMDVCTFPSKCANRCKTECVHPGRVRLWRNTSLAPWGCVACPGTSMLFPILHESSGCGGGGMGVAVKATQALFVTR